jgi:SAM-dependent methyltransferase
VSLARTLETLSVLGDENRLRLCMLLADRELNVGDLVRVTGIAQSRVSTHLGRLREAGIVRDRKDGTQCFYALATDSLPSTVTTVLGEARDSGDATLLGDRERLHELDAERRAGRDTYSPGRTWQSLAVGVAALLDLGDVLDVGSGDASAASMIAPYCRSLTCIDTQARAIETAAERFAGKKHVTTRVADAEALPFPAASFDTVLVFHTLTYTERPDRALVECARVLRTGGRIVVLCLDEHRHQEVTARYGERHPGLSPDRVRSLLTHAGLSVRTCEVASREAKKPHLQVVLAIAEKSGPLTTKIGSASPSAPVTTKKKS